MIHSLQPRPLLRRPPAAPRAPAEFTSDPIVLQGRQNPKKRYFEKDHADIHRQIPVNPLQKTRDPTAFQSTTSHPNKTMKNHRFNPFRTGLAAATLTFTLLAAGPAVAGNVWDGGGFGGDNWTFPGNWDGDAVPNYANDLTFTGNVRNTPLNDRPAASTVKGFLFTNDGSTGKTNAFTITGTSITLTGNITTTANTAGATITDIIDLDMSISGARVITTNQQSGTVQHNLTLSGDISGTGGITKTGGGVLTLTGANSFSGQVAINFAGTISVNSIANGGLDSPLGRNATIRIGNAGSTSTLNFTAGATSTDRQIQIGDDNAAGTATGGAKINNNTPNGAGALVFTNANFNFLNNLVTVGRTLTLGGTNTDANEIQGIIADNSASGGTIAVTKEGNGRWILSNTLNSYSGDTTVNGGTGPLQLGAANVIPNSTGKGNVVVKVNTLLDLNTFSEVINGLSGAGTVDTVAGGTPTFTVGDNNQTSSFSGVIQNTAGTLALTKANNGTLTFTGTAPNTYSGLTKVNAGTLELKKDDNVTAVTGNLTIGDGSGTDTVKTTNHDQLDSPLVTISSSGVLNLSGKNQNIGRLEGTGTVDNGGAAACQLALNSATDAIFDGTITQTGGGALALLKEGNNTVTLTGTNTYTGDTTVNAGTLAVDGDSIANSGKLVIAGGMVNATGSETVNTLFFGATQQAAGTWGSSSSAAVAPFVDDTRFSGTGVVVVTAGPAPSSGYAAWQTANSTAQAANLDHDNDGVSNGVEHFLGGTGNTTGFTTPLPGVTNTAGTLSVTWGRHPDFPGFPGNYGTAVIVETSATLADPWTPAVEGVGAGFVEITGNDVKYTFPAGTKNFARLKVVTNP